MNSTRALPEIRYVMRPGFITFCCFFYWSLIALFMVAAPFVTWKFTTIPGVFNFAVGFEIFRLFCFFMSLPASFGIWKMKKWAAWIFVAIGLVILVPEIGNFIFEGKTLEGLFKSSIVGVVDFIILGYYWDRFI